MYYDDRSQCKTIKEKTLERVKHRSEETLNGSLDVVRKVKVYGARWPDDDDTDRALRSFRKYVKVSFNARKRFYSLDTVQSRGINGVTCWGEMKKEEEKIPE